MIASLSLPGMFQLTILIVVLHVLSLAFMALILFSFRRTRVSQRMMIDSLIDAFDPSSVPPVCRRHRRLYPVRLYAYFFCTVCIVIVSLYLFLFQPHLL